jgi:hypothetical protein
MNASRHLGATPRAGVPARGRRQLRRAARLSYLQPLSRGPHGARGQRGKEPSVDHPRNHPGRCRASREKPLGAGDDRHHPRGRWRSPVRLGLHGPRCRGTQALLLICLTTATKGFACPAEPVPVPVFDVSSIEAASLITPGLFGSASVTGRRCLLSSAGSGPTGVVSRVGQVCCPVEAVPPAIPGLPHGSTYQPAGITRPAAGATAGRAHHWITTRSRPRSRPWSRPRSTRRLLSAGVGGHDGVKFVQRNCG